MESGGVSIRSFRIHTMLKDFMVYSDLSQTASNDSPSGQLASVCMYNYVFIG